MISLNHRQLNLQQTLLTIDGEGDTGSRFESLPGEGLVSYYEHADHIPPNTLPKPVQSSMTESRSYLDEVQPCRD